MKHFFILVFFFAPLFSNAQAHLGSTLSDLKSKYPEKTFKMFSTDDGSKYTIARQAYGDFVYYFDTETRLTNLCIQIPHSMAGLNTQIEIYNIKYVIISDTKWKAYFEEGGKINIELVYDKDFKKRIFTYIN
jgi:hypothetical protein